MGKNTITTDTFQSVTFHTWRTVLVLVEEVVSSLSRVLLWRLSLVLGRGCSQRRCPTETDRAPATEIADRGGRSVGARASARLPRLFTPKNVSLSAPQAPILRQNPMKINHFMPFFAQKSPAARLDATSSMACLQQATVLANWGSGTTSASYVTASRYSRYMPGPSRHCQRLGRGLGRSVGTPPTDRPSLGAPTCGAAPLGTAAAL